MARITLFIVMLLQCTLIFATATKPTFNLEDAINLAVRENPNVTSTRLSYTLSKLNLYISEWGFLPHYSLQAQATYTRARVNDQLQPTSRNYNVTPAVSLLTPIGTQLAITSTNSSSGHYNPGLALEITQPLIRGFGVDVVQAALRNAEDSEKISRLNIQKILQTTITSVINAYLNVVSAEGAISISEDALKRAQQSVTQTKLYIKAGHKAGNEIVTVEANVASAKSQLINNRNNLTQTRFALLTAIGVNPNTHIQFLPLNIKSLIAKYNLPDLKNVQQLSLQNDISYQTAVITLNGATERSLLLAENNALPQLTFKATAGLGNGSGGGANAGFNSLTNRHNQSQSIGLNLTIPIDDQNLKQAIEAAKIGLQQARLALRSQKWAQETAALNAYNLVLSSERALRFAEDAEVLQQKTYQINFQKYLHGLIDSLTLQTAQVQLISAQQALLSAQISYLTSLVSMDELIGNTLKTWRIGIRL